MSNLFALNYDRILNNFHEAIKHWNDTNAYLWMSRKKIFVFVVSREKKLKYKIIFHLHFDSLSIEILFMLNTHIQQKKK